MRATRVTTTACDVSKYESIDLQLVVANYGLGPMQVQIYTGNTRDPNDAVTLLVAFPTVVVPQVTYRVAGIRNFQQYIFWSVPLGSAQFNSAATIYIVGTGYWSQSQCCS
jgi:hypothetical protein